MGENCGLVMRTERLERSDRRWRIAALGLLAAIIVLLLAGFKTADFAQPDVLRVRNVEAQSFVLRDAEGQVWARMALGPDGPRLNFFDGEGRIVSSLPLKAEVRPAR